ncbi:MAG: ABC transporter substrate-binding protein [Cyclobacteriaceae bacterium]
MAKIFIDQISRKVELPGTPRRIVSLVPSITELLYDLGLYVEIRGITKFCRHPFDKGGDVVIVGGTKSLNLGRIRQIYPDLIIASKEENQKEQIEELSKHFPVWVSDVVDLSGALGMIKSIGEVTDTGEKAVQMTEAIKKGWVAVKRRFDGKALYLIWNNPAMTIGNDTYIHAVLTYMGLENIANRYSRYPILTDEILNSNPDYVFLSSEPFPFKEKHLKHYQKLFPNAQIALVDGEMFSWYGSRMLIAPDYFKTFLSNSV